jgi:hypothetical protein
MKLQPLNGSSSSSAIGLSPFSATGGSKGKGKGNHNHNLSSTLGFFSDSSDESAPGIELLKEGRNLNDQFYFITIYDIRPNDMDFSLQFRAFNADTREKLKLTLGAVELRSLVHDDVRIELLVFVFLIFPTFPPFLLSLAPALGWPPC